MEAPHRAEYLFVYGTLKRGFPNPWSRRLWSQARFAGEASLPGRLYDLGPYPALVADDASPALVRGEVAELASPAILAQLDHYEGPQYKRVLRAVNMRDGTVRQAWVYVLRAAPRGARLISEGWWPVE